MNLDILSQVIPHLLVIAALAGIIGWVLRGKSSPPKKAVETPPRDRPRTSDAALEQSRAAQKALKTELEALRADSAPKAALESVTAELETARQSLAAEKNRAAALDTDLRKARETIRQLNAKNSEGDKARNDRAFALENELSKTREQLSVLHSRPDDTAVLQAEIDRLRESVAVTTRYAGELRKREAAANEALAKLQDRVANSPTPLAIPAAPVRTGDSDRVVAAKAEVMRLNALRSAPKEPKPAAPAQPQLEFPVDPPVETPAIADAPVEEAAPGDEQPLEVESEVAAVEQTADDETNAAV